MWSAARDDRARPAWQPPRLPDISACPCRSLHDPHRRSPAHNGIAAIWEAHVAAAAAHGLGEHELAASLIEIAEATERLWAARQTVNTKVGPQTGFYYAGASFGSRTTSRGEASTVSGEPLALRFVNAVTGPPPRSAFSRITPMPFVIGSATLACTMLSLSLGQAPLGMQALGVMLASAVVMSLSANR